jgi:nitrogen regulatory protein P-II 1|tara:strand:+ start:2296 stop:2634 length:339 start_codon:yes stop_codon:yes gene_type:complete
MKKIEAIIKPFKIDDVKEALEAVGVRGMTVVEAAGYGRQKGKEEIFRGSEHLIDFIPKVKLELVVDDEMLWPAIEAIKKAANTNRIGDGKIFVTNIETAIRIRTSETGSDAL